MKIYIVYDKVANQPLMSIIAQSKAVAIRQIVPTLIQRFPLRDLILYETQDSVSELIDTAIKVNWDEYKYPETRADALAPLNIVDYSKSEVKDE